nr:prosaposin-like [Ipomoea trifida]
MDRRLCLVLLVLAISCCCTAKDLAAKTESLEKQVQVSANEYLCLMCKGLVTMLSDEQTQREIIGAINAYCFNFFPSQECYDEVDTISNIFKIISSSTPESFCQEIGFCEKVVSISEYASNSSCDLCHRTVMEATQQLKNPDTQVEVRQLLLKACDSATNFSTKCKKLVFKYAPLILVKAEQFPKTNDICSLLPVCDSPIPRMEAAS